jgi:Kelch motif
MPWMAEKALPTASMGLAAAVCDAPPTGSGEWIYAIGGASGNLIAAVAGYDTVQESWFARPSMPTPRTAVAAATSPGRIHVLGGFGNANLLTTHEVYEPANDAWSTAAPLPTPRGAFAAVTGPDGLIYAIGGYDGNNPLATVDAYDPTSDKWITKAPMHSPRTWHAAVTGHDGLIYAIGGGIPAMLSSMEVFNVKTNIWTTSPSPLPVATCGLAAAVDPSGLIYVIGAIPRRVARPAPTSTATTLPPPVGRVSRHCRVDTRPWPPPRVPTASSMPSAAPTAPNQLRPSRHIQLTSATPSSTRSRWSKTTSALRRATWEIFPHRLGRVPRRRSLHCA